MPSVLDVSLDLFRAHGMTTIFGNPGSTELPMLANFPADFSYVLGLQEAVVVGMADGFAQASRQPTHVNLHTAPGVGNAMGAIFNAQANKAPLVITAGQQARSMITMKSNLTNWDAARIPAPYVKWAFEPPRAQDVPLALAHAIHIASLPPQGPAFVSIPMDDWDAQADDATTANVLARRVHGRAVAEPSSVRMLAKRLTDARNPVMVAGPDIDSNGGWDAAISLAQKLAMPVWASPATGGNRLGFPEGHACYRGVLPPAVGPIAQTLEGHDLILVAGTSVFPYYPNIPGSFLPEGAVLIAITSDPDEAARAPMGYAMVADVALTLAALDAAITESGKALPDPLPPPEPVEDTDPMSQSAALGTLAEVFPADGIIALEAPTATLATRNRLRISSPGSYFFCAGGGLGWGLSAAVGIQMAQPGRPVVCVMGEGSAQYAITALWTAAAYKVPLTVLVLRNGEYGILKWFAALEQVEGAPGLDLPALDTVAVAAGYGVDARRVGGREELRDALAQAIASPAPALVEVDVAPGMSLG